MPRVSVVLTVFNGASTVAETLDSIVGQTFQDFEVLVVDDGSEDATPDILHRYANVDKRFVITRTPNRGVAIAPNKALDMAQGEFVARIDADDICHPERFERQLEYLDHVAGAAAVGSQVRVIDASAAPVPRQPSLDHSPIMKDRCKRFTYFPPAPPTIAHSTAMIRRNDLEAAGRYRACFAIGSEDRDLWWRLGQVGEIHRIAARLVDYREHARSFSATRHRDLVTSALVADLSAIARHFGIADEPLLATWTRANGVAVLQKYAELIGERYPVRALVYYRATKRKVPDLASWIDKPSMRREIAQHLIRKPNPMGRWRLLQAVI